MLAPGLTYLQTGSLGPTPRAVLDRTIEAWHQLELNPATMSYNEGPVHAATNRVREQAAALLGCAADELLITRSTTDGMTTAALGTRLRRGDRVLTTDQEHDGGSVCWKYLARRHGIVIDVVPIAPLDHDPRAIVDRFARAMTSDTRVISVSHVITSTGFHMPIAELSALARAQGALCIVDGAQALGQIPVDVRALGCHAYAANGHKWLMAPKGTGLLYVSPDAAPGIEPVQREDGLTFVAHSTGMGSLPLIIGLGAAVERLMARGLPAVQGRIRALRDRAYAGLMRIPRLRVVSVPTGPLATGLVAFTLPDAIDSRVMRATLQDKYRIVVKMIEKKWLNGIRLSTHVFNTEDDIDRVLHALRSELA
jgi:selenocysteine lyase/cysteine desulfurase